jgi:xanthine dehydrogenase YagR molybdenum-binding subunit
MRGTLRWEIASGDYMIPVNADIGEVRIIMVPEEDRIINPIGVKGIGEIGIVGTSAALANAIYHATGQRLRDLPLRIDSLITGSVTLRL